MFYVWDPDSKNFEINTPIFKLINLESDLRQYHLLFNEIDSLKHIAPNFKLWEDWIKDGGFVMIFFDGQKIYALNDRYHKIDADLFYKILADNFPKEKN